MVPGADAYWITKVDATDLRVHEIADSGATTASWPTLPSSSPFPASRSSNGATGRDVGRLDTVDCSIPSSVFGLGCRSDVGLRHAIVHHTVNSNGYAESSVPSLLFGIQRYHMQTRGWDDIGYNFVIDRFGRIWQAREADLYEPISAGHTTGLNAESVGVAVLGTFSTGTVPDAVVDVARPPPRLEAQPPRRRPASATRWCARPVATSPIPANSSTSATSAATATTSRRRAPAVVALRTTSTRFGPPPPSSCRSSAT